MAVLLSVRQVFRGSEREVITQTAGRSIERRMKRIVTRMLTTGDLIISFESLVVNPSRQL